MRCKAREFTFEVQRSPNSALQQMRISRERLSLAFRSRITAANVTFWAAKCRR